ncbi:MAG: retropepsin-like aspartic protease, partial [Verrucomicrobiales bacterium]
KDQTLLAADLFKDIPGARRDHDAILGAEFMSQLRAVISYKEGRIFLRPDLVDNDEEIKVVEAPKYRLFKLKSGKVRAARVKKKNPSSTELNLVNREGEVTGDMTIINADFSAEDQEYIEKWTPERDLFLRQCRGLSVQDILELREYESFEYIRRGNHIFVDGKLNGHDRRFMIDTGAGSTVLHVEDAEETGCAVGPMTEKVYGIGGEAPAARTDVPSVELGSAKFENRQLLSLDMFKQHGGRGNYCGLFGADFLRETDAVITYREQKIFLKSDKAVENNGKKPEGGE